MLYQLSYLASEERHGTSRLTDKQAPISRNQAADRVELAEGNDAPGSGYQRSNAACRSSDEVITKKTGPGNCLVAKRWARWSKPGVVANCNAPSSHPSGISPNLPGLPTIQQCVRVR